MEPIWEAAKRVIEPLLDERVALVTMMADDDPRKAELNREIHALEELLMAETL
jgi:hypothetical protein